MVKKFTTGSLACSILGAAGVVVTTVLTAKLAPKAQKRVEKMKQDLEAKGETAKKGDILIANIKSYWPAILSGGATLASIFTSQFLSKKAEVSLIAAAGTADQLCRKYKNQIRNVAGKTGLTDIINKISKDDYEQVKPEQPTDNRKLFWEEHVGFFYADELLLERSMTALNQRINDSMALYEYEMYGIATIADLITGCEAEILNKNIKLADLNFGWSFDYLADSWEGYWIHDYREELTTEDGKSYTRIIFTEDPVYNPIDWYDYKVEKLITKEEYYGDRKDLMENECENDI